MCLSQHNTNNTWMFRQLEISSSLYIDHLIHSLFNLHSHPLFLLLLIPLPPCVCFSGRREGSTMFAHQRDNTDRKGLDKTVQMDRKSTPLFGLTD